MITIFDDDFDKADHIGEIRKIHTPVPVLPLPPVEPEVRTRPRKPVGGNPTRDAARRVLARFGRGEA